MVVLTGLPDKALIFGSMNLLLRKGEHKIRDLGG